MRLLNQCSYTVYTMQTNLNNNVQVRKDEEWQVFPITHKD